MYDGARVPSPQDSANGFSQPGGSAGRPKSDEESEKPEPVLVKRAHREILDHERKRRVELKCMELQEMMEEQGYPEDEIRQKVGTFRQMLMEKEGVLTREGSHSRQIVNHTAHSCEEERDDSDSLAEGYAPECDCHGGYYGDGDSVGHGNYRMKRKLSSSPSPPPKKRKKKKSGHRRSRFDSSSPPRKEKKKKSRKKHKRDRSASGSRKKRRYRSGSPKSKHKDKNKQRRRSPVDSPGRRSHRRGSCSSRSASVSSTASLSRSPGRTNSKHGADSHKPRPGQSSRSVSLSPACGTNSAVRQNGHRNGKGSGPDHAAGDPLQDKISVVPTSPSGRRPQLPQPEQRKVRNEGGGSPGRLTDATSGDEAHGVVRRSTSVSSGKRGRRQKALGKSSHSPTHSSDSAHSQRSQVQNSRSSQSKKAGGAHLSRRRRRSRPRARHRSSSGSPGRRRRHAAVRKKSSSRAFRQRSSSWSSACSASCSRSASRSRSPEHGSKAKSPYSRQNDSRDKDSAPPTDTEGRARRRSRTYSPIRKRRRDSPSFMEARRITSARKRPIPYYRPSPSSSSYPSSPSASSRSCSRSYRVYSSYSRSRSRSRSYYSRSSSESPGF